MAGAASATAAPRSPALILMIFAVGAALVLTAFTDVIRGEQVGFLVALLAVYVISGRTGYVHENYRTVPTQPVLVAMLFLIPLTLVPITVLVGQCLLAWLDRRGASGDGDLAVQPGLPSRVMDSLPCLGPVAMLLLVEPGPAELQRWPVYLAAVMAQILIDGLVSVVRRRSGASGSTLMDRPAWLWARSIDVMLSVVGFSAVLAGGLTFATVALVAVPTGLIALLIQDRRGLADNQADLGVAVESARGEARIDALTGVGNRRAWAEAIGVAQDALVAEPGSVVTVVLADLNGLKAANDALGHDAGDALIRAMGVALTAVANPGDVVCRFGGDEFAMLRFTPPTTDGGAAGSGTLADPVGRPAVDALLAQIREAVALQPPVSGVALSVALGGSQAPPQRTVEDAYLAADTEVFVDKRALYARLENERRQHR